METGEASEGDCQRGARQREIVKNFVEAHGGQVWLDTAVEEGATFVVLLPVAPVGDNKGS